MRTKATLTSMGTFLVLAAWASAAEKATAPAPDTDWPQLRGVNRDSTAVSSPRLLDRWPKEGPPLLWKSDWIPACEEGGVGSPVVADGKVFLYVNWKQPVGGGDSYHVITTELLLAAGWLPDLPDDLAKTIEAAWASKNRPSSAGWHWWDLARSKDADLDAFLAKKPELDKYIKDFIATLKPEDARKYGSYVRRRLCIDTATRKWGIPDGFTWEQLTKLSAMRTTEIRTLRQWQAALGKISAYSLVSYPNYVAWKRAFTWSDVVVCLDAATGKELWKKVFPVDEAVVRDPGVQWWVFDQIGVSSTATAWGGKVYAQGDNGLYCLSAKDGALIWKVAGSPEHSSPLVAKGVVYNVGRAYDAETGALRWKHPLWNGKHIKGEAEGRYSSPILWTTGGKDFVITTDLADVHDTSYCCLELQTGKLAWKLKSPVSYMPTIQNDIMLAPPLYGAAGSRTKAYQMTPAGPKLLWSSTFGLGGFMYQDHLYVPSAVYACMDWKTREFNWKKSFSDGVCEASSPVFADEKIFTPLGQCHQLTKGFGDLTYSLSMVKATPEKFVELGRFNPRMCMMSSPAFVDGKLYLRLLDGIACYDLQEHGVCLDGTRARKDAIAFQFKQTGGGLVAKDAATGVLIADASGVAKPAHAKINGDYLVVDIKDAAVPFAISYAGRTLSGKNGLPVPPFGWNESRLLKYRKSLDNTLMLSSDLPLQQIGIWNKAETFAVAGAKVTGVALDPQGKGVKLATDKTWKPGDTVTVTYPSFPVEQGDARRETLTATVVELQRPAASFVKVDETTSGNWKGIYGAEGAVVCADKAGVPPKCAIVTPIDKQDFVGWAPNAADPRNLQKSGAAKDRTVAAWRSEEQFDIAVDITDGKEHQMALCCLAGASRWELVVEVLDGDTRAVLDTQTVKDFYKGKYLIWNVKGNVIVRVSTGIHVEGSAAVASGVFFDPPARTAK